MSRNGVFLLVVSQRERGDAAALLLIPPDLHSDTSVPSVVRGLRDERKRKQEPPNQTSVCQAEKRVKKMVLSVAGDHDQQLL